MIKSARRAAAVAALATASAVLAPVDTASAAVSPALSSSDVTCHVFEQWEFAGRPAQWLIQWETSGSSNGCTATIWREDSSGSGFYEEEGRTIQTTGSDASSWYEVKRCAFVAVFDRNGVEVDGPLIVPFGSC